MELDDLVEVGVGLLLRDGRMMLQPMLRPPASSPRGWPLPSARAAAGDDGETGTGQLAADLAARSYCDVPSPNRAEPNTVTAGPRL